MPLRTLNLAVAVAVLAGLRTEVCQSQDKTVELLRDDFARFPPGPLTAPLGHLNPAIQEYHYLAHRGVPLGPWANAICHMDCWAAGEDDGKPFIEQHLAPDHQRMAPKVFAPIFLTGEPEWRDYTVEVSVRPLSAVEMAGVVFRYRTNRHHYLFCLQNGRQARLAFRRPIEKKYHVVDWKEMGTVDFPYDGTRYYRLKVENKGPSIRAFIDDKLLIEATDNESLAGKTGIAATSPARFQDFRITTTESNRQAVFTAVRKRNSDLTALQARNPKPTLWKKFATPSFGAGRNVRFGDLDGDGVQDMLVGQNVHKVLGDSAVELSCLTAVTLDGKVLWQVGRPDPRNGLLTCDTPFQIHDIDGSGRNDVVMVKDFKLQVLDGRTGKVKRSTPMPKVEGFPKVPQKPPASWPYERNLGDSLAFVNFSGGKTRGEIVIKDRYWNFWIYDRNLKFLWSGQGMLGHYPFAYPGGKAGRDQLAIGYSLWDSAGKQLWTLDQQLKQHADSVFVGNITGNANEPPRAYYCGSDEGVIVVDHRGIVEKHALVGHAQTACIGKFRSDLPGLQYAAVNFWGNPGIVSLFDAHGKLLQQAEPIHSGSPFQTVNWRGDGQEFILLSANVAEGGMIDGNLQRAVVFPDDGHPDLTVASLDLTGDPRDEIVVWDQNSVWIYIQDQPFTGNRIYAPTRNPPENDSNYRISMSLPNWHEHPKADSSR